MSQADGVQQVSGGGGGAVEAVLLANLWADETEIAEAIEALGEDPDPTLGGGACRLVRRLVEQGRMTATQATDLDHIITQQGYLPNFQILRKIGSGGMGVVYFARHLGTGRTCALKTINARLAEDQDTVSRFRRETETLSAISHANIAEVIDVGERDGHVYLAMQYIDGPSLGSLLKDHHNLPELYALRAMRQIADGLSYVYSAAGLIHRDIKPENVLVQRLHGGADPFPRDDIAKLIDFGLVKSMDDRQLNLTQAGMTIGTPLYMSPEQVRGDPLDCRSDIYGIAATLYHLVTGTTPFIGMSPGAIMSAHLTKPIPDPTVRVPTLHPLTRKVIMTGMAKDFVERFRDYQALTQAIDAAIAAVVARDGERAPEAKGAEKAEARTSDEKSGEGSAGHAAAGSGGHGAEQAAPAEEVHETGRFRPTVAVDLPNIAHLAPGASGVPAPQPAPPPVVPPPTSRAARPGSGGSPAAPRPPAGKPAAPAGDGARAGRPTTRAPDPRPASAPGDHGHPPALGTPAGGAPAIGVSEARPATGSPSSGGLPGLPAMEPIAQVPLSDAPPLTETSRRPRTVAPPGTGLGAQAQPGEVVIHAGDAGGGTGTARSTGMVGAVKATATNAGSAAKSTATSTQPAATGSMAKAAPPEPPPAPEPDSVSMKALELELTQAKHVPQTSLLPWILLGAGVLILGVCYLMGWLGG
jgi:serine/threonine-protein kinase